MTKKDRLEKVGLLSNPCQGCAEYYHDDHSRQCQVELQGACRWIKNYDAALVSDVREVYEKYKHLGDLLSDCEWLKAKTAWEQMVYDFWQAIRKTVEEEKR